MPRKQKQRQVAFQHMVCKASNNVLEPGAVRFLYDDLFRRVKVFSMRMPISNAFEPFEIPIQLYNSQCLPMATGAMLDYVTGMKQALAVARDLQPFNGDLSPITPEEKQVFGVRENFPNPCIPRRHGNTQIFTDWPSEIGASTYA